ncbi:DUF2950 domain-containing protein [Limobrevibacterium gyesilva]|uniref:DUF2950 domain-containing protein n=1 Tax=Limobrevibacterium gyesilva TaxID=2991712 RepID=A0AA42CEE7_9PROT|nr:DUF2950 domain-containing protein [Limobrevibacterium gyesilva]MCW3475189.1 DUF2950 domain-containing protein [Limobrevibacterium gyesilva]
MRFHLRQRASTVLLLVAIACTGAPRSPVAAPPQKAPVPQTTFQTPDDATQALVDALKANDPGKLRAVLGPGSERLVGSGDPVADAAQRQRFLAAYAEKHDLETVGENRRVLHVGQNDWPLPMPLVADGGRWRFDSTTGAQEIVNRRIGRNELAAIGVMLAYVQAQRDFAARDRQAGGPGAYAQRLFSSPGKHDGLYWPAAAGEPDSPLAELIQRVASEGYPGEPSKGPPRPYQGYLFRLLKAQGPNAPGGAKDYVVDGRMTSGFALVAWPAVYGASGITTFLVNQDGVVFQKDLGPRTGALAGAMTRFDPDITWARVDVVEH